MSSYVSRTASQCKFVYDNFYALHIAFLFVVVQQFYHHAHSHDSYLCVSESRGRRPQFENMLPRQYISCSLCLVVIWIAPIQRIYDHVHIGV